jgi:septum formation protein
LQPIAAAAAMSDAPRLVLASGSRTRRSMLEAAGVTFEVIPADVDERGIQDRILSGDPEVPRARIAEALARAKAEKVSTDHPGALVIGSDQVLAFGSEILEKPATLDDARASLAKLRGARHALHSSAALARNGRSDWAETSTANLEMRAFSDAALEAYLARVGDAILGSVGAYQIEGPAIQLFKHIEGDHFTILGMPLLPVLAELRARKVLLS